ncbi:hypothetical protein NJB14195_45480 [Mycobacterium montefiorense]|nr:hypothetical protein NJB14195_45480 [Mycobacterium montefiorense]
MIISQVHIPWRLGVAQWVIEEPEWNIELGRCGAGQGIEFSQIGINLVKGFHRQYGKPHAICVIDVG